MQPPCPRGCSGDEGPVHDSQVSGHQGARRGPLWTGAEWDKQGCVLSLWRPLQVSTSTCCVSHDSQLSSAYRNSRMQWAQRAVGSVSASQEGPALEP